MKKLVLIGLCCIVAAVLISPVNSANARVNKATGKDAIQIIPAVEMFPNSIYDNDFQIPEASGKINMVQPKGKYAVIITAIVKGLDPDSVYKVYFDEDGVVQGDVSTAGPWTLMDEIVTDEDGNATWKYKIAKGELQAGEYTKAIGINRTDPGATVLISCNIDFVIE